MSTAHRQLGDVAEFINGAAFQPDEGGTEGSRIIRIQNLNDPSKPYNRTTRQVSERLHVLPGDILVSWSASLGVFEWQGPDVGLVNQHIFRVLPNEGIVDKRYLRYALELALQDMQQHLHGATMMHVNRGEFLATKLYLPPLPEQRRIAAILDQAHALRAKRREALAQLDRLTQAIFVEMFGDPVSNPMGWPIHTLKELGKVSTGGTPPSGMEGMFGGAIPFVTPGDLESDEAVRRSVTEAGAHEAGTVRAGAALVCCIGATIGKMGLAKERSSFNQQLNAVEWSTTVVDDQYGFGVLAFFKPIIVARGASTTLPILKKSSFERISIPVPPLEMQRKFASRVAAIQEMRRRMQSCTSETLQLFTSLQHRAFRGEL